MILHLETYSNHGTEQGIIPRFYEQIFDLAKDGGLKKEFEQKSKIYFENVIPEFTQFYDLNKEIQDLIYDYKEGVRTGRYFSISERGHSVLNKHNELKIQSRVKDFFIRGKIAIVYFMKCGIIDDDSDFKLEKFFLCKKDEDFNKRKTEYINKHGNKYKPILDLFQKYKSDINDLSEFNEIRGDIEHNPFKLDDFVLINSTEGISIKEPMIKGVILSSKLQSYLDNIFDFIEKILVYYYGINGELKTKGFFKLYERINFNYSLSEYKYIFEIEGNPQRLPSRKCLYD